jgi:hypothetical protein
LLKEEVMNLALHLSPPWPSPPPGSAGPVARLTWCAAVARWAPSKHNTQPWRFVVCEDALEIWADSQRMLPESDPHRRELVLSCGAAVQLACVAARALGVQPEVTLLPDGGGSLLARVVEAGPWATSEQDRHLLQSVARRRTDRGPLDADALPPSTPFLLQSAAEREGASLRLVAIPGERATLARLVERADRLLVRSGGVDHELQSWLREPGDHRRDGVQTDLTRGAAASYRAEFVQRDFSGASGSRALHDRAGADHPILGILCTPGDLERDWLLAGRALAAVLLCAAEVGADSSYLNQPVEEPTIRTELQTQFALVGSAQVVLRLGVGGAVPRTVRRRPSEVTSWAAGPGGSPR